MSAPTTQLLSSGEFCKLRYDTIPVKRASANVYFLTNNSKMPNFVLWHSCRKWAIYFNKYKFLHSIHILHLCDIINLHIIHHQVLLWRWILNLKCSTAFNKLRHVNIPICAICFLNIPRILCWEIACPVYYSTDDGNSALQNFGKHGVRPLNRVIWDVTEV